MSCSGCQYLNIAEIAEGGKMNTCNACILEDGNGRPMLSIYISHDWCPILNLDMRKKVE